MKEAGGRMKEAGGRMKEAGGRMKEAGGRRQDYQRPGCGWRLCYDVRQNLRDH